MKRIITLVLAAAMVLGAVSAANAVDIKVKGTWDFAYLWTSGTTNGGQARSAKNEANWEDDNFNAAQRIRTQINFVASEQLQGVLMFEIGTIMWGGHGEGTSGRSSGGALDADGVNIETKRAYLDWMVPCTDLAIRMGIQALNLPMASGYSNPVFSADVAGIVANYKFNDMVALTAFWARPFDAGWNDSKDASGNVKRFDETDVLGVMLPITGTGWSVTPWAMYANIGSNSGLLEYWAEYSGRNHGVTIGNGPSDRTNAFWAGGSFEVSVLDPLTFGLDVMYGKMNSLDVNITVPGSSLTLPASFETEGWFIAGALNYQMDWATPGLFAWWSSGDDWDDVARKGKFGHIPTIGVDDGFGPTSFGWPGCNGPIGDSAVGVTAVGTWGIGLQLADMSFIEDLSHTVRVAYYSGTNDKKFAKYLGDSLKLSAENVYLVTGDNVYEVNFDTEYKIYENLSTFLELGYIHLDLTECENPIALERSSSNAWKAQVLFKYAF